MSLSVTMAILGEALDSLRVKWRTSLLAMFVLAGGVSALIIIMGVLQGFTHEIERASFGVHARSLVVTSNLFFAGRADPLQLADRVMLQKKLKGVQSSAAWRAGIAPVQMPGTGRMEQIRIYGGVGKITPETGAKMILGRMLTIDELKSRQRLCVLGNEAYLNLFSKGGLAINQGLRINGMSCKVVGVLALPRDRVGEHFANAVIAPFGVAAYYLIPGKDNTGPADISQLTFTFLTSSQADSQHIVADRILRQRHGVPLSRVSPFSFANTDASADSLLRQRNLVATLLAAVSAITMLTVILGYSGLISHQSAMRQEEMAIRAAVGAHGPQLMGQMVLEQLGIGLGGGLIGVLTSVVFTLGLRHWLSWLGVPDWGWFFLALGVGALLGMLIGLSPSLRAARTPPGMLFGPGA